MDDCLLIIEGDQHDAHNMLINKIYGRIKFYLLVVEK